MEVGLVLQLESSKRSHAPIQLLNPDRASTRTVASIFPIVKLLAQRGTSFKGICRDR
jgi:hypothetical protein